MQDIELDLAEADLVATLQPARRRKALHIRKAEHLALLRHAVDPETVVDVRPFDRHAGTLDQRSDGAGVVDVAMRHENLGQTQLLFGKHAQDAVDIAARINDRRLTGGLAPENGAVLLERGDWNNRIAHDSKP